MTTMNVNAQRIQVVDSNGQGIPLVSVLTEDGIYIGKTDLDGVLSDVKGAKKVGLTHVAYKPKLVTVASLPNGRVEMVDLNFNISEVVIKPKPYVYVEAPYDTRLSYCCKSLLDTADMLPVTYTRTMSSSLGLPL